MPCPVSEFSDSLPLIYIIRCKTNPVITFEDESMVVTTSLTQIYSEMAGTYKRSV